MTDTDDIKPYLLAEFDQAWMHYRHVESMRTQYLGFFFTISLGSTALAVPAVSADALDNPSRLASFAVFLWVFSAVASFIYISVRKAGPVLSHYEAVMRAVRERWYTSPDDTDLPSLFDVRVRLAGVARSAAFSTQWSAEWTIRFFHLLATAALLLLMVRADQRNASGWIVAGTGLGVASSLALVVVVSLLDGEP